MSIARTRYQNGSLDRVHRALTYGSTAGANCSRTAPACSGRRSLATSIAIRPKALRSKQLKIFAPRSMPRRTAPVRSPLQTCGGTLTPTSCAIQMWTGPRQPLIGTSTTTRDTSYPIGARHPSPRSKPSRWSAGSAPSVCPFDKEQAAEPAEHVVLPRHPTRTLWPAYSDLRGQAKQ